MDISYQLFEIDILLANQIEAITKDYRLKARFAKFYLWWLTGKQDGAHPLPDYNRYKKEIDKAVIGTEVVLKNLKNKKLSKVYLASNCHEKTKKDIESYSQLVNVPIVMLDINNEELGVFCKKHFFISVLGIKRK